VPADLVVELVAEHRPASIEHGLGHPRRCKLGDVHIADRDQPVLSSDPSGLLVQVMAPALAILAWIARARRVLLAQLALASAASYLR